LVDNSFKEGMDKVKESIGPINFPKIEMGSIGYRPRIGKAGLGKPHNRKQAPQNHDPDCTDCRRTQAERKLDSMYDRLDEEAIGSQ
jgi:hypothetical protein